MKLKDILTEGSKNAALWDVENKMKDGSFNPDDPEVIIFGFGRVTLSQMKKMIQDKLSDLVVKSKRGDYNFIADKITNPKSSGIFHELILGVVEVEEQLIKMRTKIKNYKKRTGR